jgi:DNA recombination protein RmuC
MNIDIQWGWMLAAWASLAVWMAVLAGLVLRRLHTPPAWSATLQTLEQSSAALLQATARHEGALQTLGQQLQAMQHAHSSAAAALQSTIEAGLGRAVTESRQGRTELLAAFGGFESKLEQRLQGLDASLTQRLTALQGGLTEHLQGQGQQLAAQAAALQTTLTDTLQTQGRALETRFAALQASLTQQLGQLVQSTQTNADSLRSALNERLAAIQQDNSVKLEDMRRTVDEKLHATLEQRLGESFKLVSERLEQVQAGLGEMKTLAGSVGDLKRVMTNVKTRGTWGEMQLGAIIDNVLTPDQYAHNVKTNPHSNDLVEYAIRLPGKRDEQPVWLPIDAKYPVEHYQRLLDAQDELDKPALQQAGAGLEASIRLEARKIASKYLAPPYTTDFALLYLPSESLFAEVLRRPGLAEAVQNESRVLITGPANLAAMLNSLQMGFKTLAIEKRSSEVWNLLGLVKTEFNKFGDVVEATKKSIDAAAAKFTEVGVRTRAIQRKLREVQELPAPDAANAPALGVASVLDLEPE